MDALKASAKSLAVVAPDFKSGSGKGLEAAVLFSLAAACREDFEDVVACDYAGEPLVGAFILRGAPGHLADPCASGPEPSYFRVSKAGVEFELHNSLEYLGASGVEHEVDVSAVWRTVADGARSSPKRVPKGPPLVGIELKELSAGSYADKNVLRAFFGCIVDFNPTWTVNWVAVGTVGAPRGAISRQAE